MGASDSKSLPAIGFLTVVEHDSHGLFGGYLILNLGGRPLEFHCTAPVRPNRAQEILYGPTLKPFLFGEQIGQTLVRRAKTKPLIVCTDVEDAMSVRDHVSYPVALVLVASPPADEDSRGEAEGMSRRLDGPHATAAPKREAIVRFRVGSQELAVLASHAQDQPSVAERLDPLVSSFDLSEPFARIRDAIDEAQRGGR